MQMDIMELGLYQTNCYIVWEGKDGIVIDPGYDAARILARLEELGVVPLAVVLTHGHFDHVGAVGELANAFDCPVYVAEEDTRLPPKYTLGPIPCTDFLSNGETLTFGPISTKVLHTPGHTPGSCCLIVGDWIFSGDTLFRDTCGRVDLPGGDFREMYRSLRKLYELEGDYSVFPGHGDATTLERERKYNPYMRGAISQ